MRDRRPAAPHPNAPPLPRPGAPAAAPFRRPAAPELCCSGVDRPCHRQATKCKDRAKRHVTRATAADNQRPRRNRRRPGDATLRPQQRRRTDNDNQRRPGPGNVVPKPRGSPPSPPSGTPSQTERTPTRHEPSHHQCDHEPERPRHQKQKCLDTPTERETHGTNTSQSDAAHRQRTKGVRKRQDFLAEREGNFCRTSCKCDSFKLSLDCHF